MGEELCFPLRQEKLRLKVVGKAVGLIPIFLASPGRSIGLLPHTVAITDESCLGESWGWVPPEWRRRGGESFLRQPRGPEFALVVEAFNRQATSYRGRVRAEGEAGRSREGLLGTSVALWSWTVGS